MPDTQFPKVLYTESYLFDWTKGKSVHSDKDLLYSFTGFEDAASCSVMTVIVKDYSDFRVLETTVKHVNADTFSTKRKIFGYEVPIYDLVRQAIAGINYFISKHQADESEGEKDE